MCNYVVPNVLFHHSNDLLTGPLHNSTIRHGDGGAPVAYSSIPSPDRNSIQFSPRCTTRGECTRDGDDNYTSWISLITERIPLRGGRSDFTPRRGGVFNNVQTCEITEHRRHFTRDENIFCFHFSILISFICINSNGFRIFFFCLCSRRQTLFPVWNANTNSLKWISAGKESEFYSSNGSQTWIKAFTIQKTLSWIFFVKCEFQLLMFKKCSLLHWYYVLSSLSVRHIPIDTDFGNNSR